MSSDIQYHLSMLKAISKMLDEASNNNDKVKCAKEVLDESIRYLEKQEEPKERQVGPLEVPGPIDQKIDEELDKEAIKAQEELLG